MFDHTQVIFILFVVIVIIIILCLYHPYKIDKKIYDVDETYPELNTIYNSIDQIKQEFKQNNSDYKNDQGEWKDWPELDLYPAENNDNSKDTKNRTWKIVPFKAFGVVVDENCKRYPHLWKFIESVPNVKVAILSKLSPGMKLTPHRGWGSHSNHVLRCHFGISVPKEKSCYIAVGNKMNTDGTVHDENKVYHSQDKWMVFDDSKYHYAENRSDADRVVLIMDIDRPSHVKTGTSTVEDTAELINIVNSFIN